jgi:hypothetical protein
MKRFGIFQISSVRHFSPLKNWIGIFFVFLMIGAQFSCAALRDTASEESDATAVFAGVIVHSVGPYPRIYPLKVRFFDFVNKTSRERIRDYQLIRMQMMEGPFRREAHMAIDFHVPPKKKVYLGEWTFEIDTPRTVRMARIHISDQYPQSLPSNETEGIGSGEFHTVLPEPQYEEFRLFVVAPSPRARYFTR